MTTRRFPRHPQRKTSTTDSMTQCHELHALAALRRSLGVSQEEMAGRLGIGQAAISKIENREDPQLHSLKRYCEALGGRLKLVVEFPASPLPAPMPVTAPDPSV